MNPSPSDTLMDTFIHWLNSRGVILHPSISLHYYGPSQNYGLRANQDIKSGSVLFSIPRSSLSTPILSIHTSGFLKHLGEPDFQQIQHNWVPLLLTMMWERARGRDSKVVGSESWKAYFDIMPNRFDTLMFWNDEELKELQTSSVLETIGREEAETDYHQYVVPLIKKRPDLFSVPSGSTWEELYGLDVYHQMGSLILSRSFELEDDQEEERSENSSSSSGSTTQDDQGGSGGIAMLPMADMLNAKSGAENARLFYEPHALNMTTTKPIKAGEQIFNTYADPPNADLLRRYGYVDEENPFDLAEVSLQLCLQHASHASHCSDLEARAEWAVQLGLDEMFMIPTRSQRDPEEEGPMPDELVTMLRILLATKEEFRKWQEKEKLPSPKLSPSIIDLGREILISRLGQYPTSIEADVELLKSADQLPIRTYQAIKVRLGEKQILIDTLNDLQNLIESSTARQSKRKHDSDDREGDCVMKAPYKR